MQMQYKVGDKVCVLIDGTSRKFEDKLHDVEITRVGSKYCYFKLDYSRNEFRISNNGVIGKEKENYSYGRVIPSKEDYLAYMDVLKSLSKLSRSITGFSVYTDKIVKMSVEDKIKLNNELDEITKIVTKDKDIDQYEK